MPDLCSTVPVRGIFLTQSYRRPLSRRKTKPQYSLMRIELPSIEDARQAVAKWLPPETACSNLFGQKTSDLLAQRFMMSARAAGFGMGLLVTEGGYIARWTHTRLKGVELPDSGIAPTTEDARVLACAALLEHPKAARLLSRYRTSQA